MIDSLPEAAQRALGLQAAIAQLGFDIETQIFVGPMRFTDEPPPPPGSTYLAVLLALDGNHRAPSFVACAGAIERAWWDGDGRLATMNTWNALSIDERHAVRLRFVPLADFYRITQALIERGIVPPAMAEMIPHGRN